MCVPQDGLLIRGWVHGWWNKLNYYLYFNILFSDCHPYLKNRNPKKVYLMLPYPYSTKYVKTPGLSVKLCTNSIWYLRGDWEFFKEINRKKSINSSFLPNQKSSVYLLFMHIPYFLISMLWLQINSDLTYKYFSSLKSISLCFSNLKKYCIFRLLILISYAMQ